jgi:hypothetical protein
MARAKKPEKRYAYFLNSYDDMRFTSCPICSAKTCRYRPGFDLLIAHRNDIEDSLVGCSKSARRR